MATASHYDLLVLGGGSGGLAMARRAAGHGARCALIEADKLGGTCVHRGCIPKKLFWYAAQIAHALDMAPDYAFALDLPSRPFDWPRFKVARDAYLKRLNQLYETGLEDSHVTLIRGHGRFVDEHTLEVEGRRYQADHIVIATGSRPVVPTLPGARYGITSDGFFGLFTQPRRAAIVGSGYIATEHAALLHALGSEVTLLIRREWFLNAFDEMIRNALMEEMERQGIQIMSNVMVAGIARDAEGQLEITTTSGQRIAGFDCLLWAVGRAPNTDHLELAAAGVHRDRDGFVPTDDFQNTNVPGIYAVGDVTGRAALTPVAIAAGRRLADRLFGGEAGSHLDYGLIPTVIFAHPPAASAGLTEDAARSRHGSAVKIYQTRFVPLQQAFAQVKSRCTMKLVTVGTEERVVGCHIVGPGADEMLQGFVVAMGMGACKRDFDRTLAIHPTAAEELVLMR